MRTKQVILVGAIAMLAAGLVGCSTTRSNRQMKERNFGVVELSPHVPKRLKIGGNKDCVVTLNILPDGNLRWEVFTETKAADGKVERSCSSSLTQRPDQKDCGVSVGDTIIILTPKVRPKNDA